MKSWAIALLIWIVAMTGYLARDIANENDARNTAASCFYN